MPAAACVRDPLSVHRLRGASHAVMMNAFLAVHKMPLDPQKWRLLKKRKVIVGPIFGLIKQAWGFRRWTIRGLENVRTERSMVCARLQLETDA